MGAPLLFSPAQQTRAEPDREQAAGLVSGWGRGGLTSGWPSNSSPLCRARRWSRFLQAWSARGPSVIGAWTRIQR